jgi:hypothetical protein
MSRLLALGVAMLIVAPVWAQQEAGGEENPRRVIIVTSEELGLDDSGDVQLIIVDDYDDYLAPGEDFVLEWSEARVTTTRVATRAVYRTVPFNIALVSPVEIFPFQDKQIMGTGISVLYGRTASLIGYQVGLVNHVTDRLFGVQAGAVNLSDGYGYGIRVGGLYTGGGRFGGISIGGLANRYADEGSWGLMISAFNQAASFTGLQIGVVNIADTLKGVQIGLMNFSRNGPLKFMPVINVGW